MSLWRGSDSPPFKTPLMKALVMKANGGLFPYSDDDSEKIKKLRSNVVYTISCTTKRNVHFHRKYFALINTAWEYLTEAQERKYGSKEAFRKTIQIAAGYYEPVFDLQEERFFKAPLSIAFDKMTEEEFEEMYNRVKDVLFIHVLKHVSEYEFLSNLNEF